MGISKRLLIGLVAVASALPALAAPAAADTLSHIDPNDTDGRLDIRRIAHSHAADGRLKHRVSTYRRFRSRALHGGRTIWMGFYQGKEELVAFASVWWFKGRLRADVFSSQEGFIGWRRVTRPNRRSVVVWLRPTDLGDPPSYRWQATTDWYQFNVANGPCSGGCWDDAPNRGYLKHVLEA